MLNDGGHLRTLLCDLIQLLGVPLLHSRDQFGLLPLKLVLRLHLVKLVDRLIELLLYLWKLRSFDMLLSTLQGAEFAVILVLVPDFNLVRLTAVANAKEAHMFWVLGGCRESLLPWLLLNLERVHLIGRIAGCRGLLSKLFARA